MNSAVAATTKVGTYKYDLDMKTNVYKHALDTAQKEIGGENTTTKDIMKVGGTLDFAKKEMHTTIDYSASLQGQSMLQLLSLEFFATGNESYMKLAVPFKSWATASLELWKNLDQASQQIELLKTAVDVDLLGTEEVNDIDCYVLKITPDSEKLAEWLSRQLALISLGNLQAKKEELLSFSIKLWIARDSYLLTKTEFELKRRERDWDNDIKGQINFYDYNQPVSIMIPQEARKATETGTPK
ncbi:MAG: hypothetical protein HYX80_04820 [Chloroflexi bacterium]|nr:hypothetical protein [Chloroflexota bacterium]